MKTIRKISKQYYAKQVMASWLVFYMLFFLAVPVRVAMATPEGGVFTVGTGAINPVVGGDTTVVVNQAKSVIEWGSPGVGGIDTSPVESLSFSQIDGLSNSAVLNRIMSGDATQFEGALNGVGMRIFIINPAGVIFGSGATVNVTQLVASSLKLADDDFINGLDNGQFKFTDGINAQNVINNGSISAERIALIGKQVINSGTIVANNGYVVLAAGDGVILTENGSNVAVEVAMGGQTPDSFTVTHEGDGMIEADGENAQVVLAAGDVWSAAIVSGGKISMDASDGITTADLETTAGGDITLIAGAGGITAGNFKTSIPSSDKATEPGDIKLFTSDGGDITMGSATISDGSDNQIFVIASGSATIDGDIKIDTLQKDRDIPHVNTKICLVANDDVTVNGSVEAVSTHGGDSTNASIIISAGNTVKVDVHGKKGQILAEAKDNPIGGTAKASIRIEAGASGPGAISITRDGDPDADIVIARAHQAGTGPFAEVVSSGEVGDNGIDEQETSKGKSTAEVQIADEVDELCSDCPKPDCPCTGPDCEPPPCEGPDCPCTGPDCEPPPCEGPDCPCTGPDCEPPPCEGPDCPCTGPDCEPPPCEGPDCPCTGPDCEPPPPPQPSALPPPPLPPIRFPKAEGCPVLMQAVAAELGVPTQTIQISLDNAAAVAPNIQPCYACEKIVSYAGTLRDVDGSHMAAMAQVFNTLAPPNAPFTPEMGAAIAAAFTENFDNPDMPQYAKAIEYIDAVVGYVTVLDDEMGSPVGDSTTFVMDKYGEPLRAGGNANMTAYIEMRIAEAHGL